MHLIYIAENQSCVELKNMILYLQQEQEAKMNNLEWYNTNNIQFY